MADSVKRKDERDKRLLEDTQRINAKFEEEMIKRRNEWNNKLAEELKEDEERYEKMQAVSKRRWEKLAEELKESKKKIEKKLQCIIPDSNGEWNNRLAEIEKLDLIILTERIFHSCKVEKISSIDDIDTKSTEKKQIQALESLRNAIKNGDRISCFSHSFF